MKINKRNKSEETIGAIITKEIEEDKVIKEPEEEYNNTDSDLEEESQDRDESVDTSESVAIINTEP